MTSDPLRPRLLADMYPADVTDDELRSFIVDLMDSAAFSAMTLAAAMLFTIPSEKAVSAYIEAKSRVFVFCEKWYRGALADRQQEVWDADKLREATGSKP